MSTQRPNAHPTQASALPVSVRAAATLARRADALFRTFSTDYLLREQFVTDPAGIASEYLRGERLDAATADGVNQLLLGGASRIERSGATGSA